MLCMYNIGGPSYSSSFRSCLQSNDLQRTQNITENYQKFPLPDSNFPKTFIDGQIIKGFLSALTVCVDLSVKWRCIHVSPAVGIMDRWQETAKLNCATDSGHFSMQLTCYHFFLNFYTIYSLEMEHVSSYRGSVAVGMTVVASVVRPWPPFAGKVQKKSSPNAMLDIPIPVGISGRTNQSSHIWSVQKRSRVPVPAVYAVPHETC